MGQLYRINTVATISPLGALELSATIATQPCTWHTTVATTDLPFIHAVPTLRATIGIGPFTPFDLLAACTLTARIAGFEHVEGRATIETGWDGHRCDYRQTVFTPFASPPSAERLAAILFGGLDRVTVQRAHMRASRMIDAPQGINDTFRIVVASGVVFFRHDPATIPSPTALRSSEMALSVFLPKKSPAI